MEKSYKMQQTQILVNPYFLTILIMIFKKFPQSHLHVFLFKVLDKDISGKIALTYPELYKDLSKGRSLSYKTFFVWCLISIYQGGVIMFGALLLFEDEFIHVVSISFTGLILTELIMVALTIRTWHWLMVIAEFISLAIYILSLIILKDIFGKFFFFYFNQMLSKGPALLDLNPMFPQEVQGRKRHLRRPIHSKGFPKLAILPNVCPQL